VSVVDRDEPIASRWEWHGDGTAGEDDHTSHLAAAASARAMGEARPRQPGASLASRRRRRGSSAQLEECWACVLIAEPVKCRQQTTCSPTSAWLVHPSLRELHLALDGGDNLLSGAFLDPEVHA
jgi:hypothetical protein